MSGKNMLEGRTGPVTQSVDAVKSLLIHLGKAINPLPSKVSLDNGRLVLILSNKKDAYYTCPSRACSCPGNQFRHDCKHQRAHFPQEQAAKLAMEGESSIRPTGKWPGGHNGPVAEMPLSRKVVA